MGSPVVSFREQSLLFDTLNDSSSWLDCWELGLNLLYVHAISSLLLVRRTLDPRLWKFSLFYDVCRIRWMPWQQRWMHWSLLQCTIRCWMRMLQQRLWNSWRWYHLSRYLLLTEPGFFWMILHYDENQLKTSIEESFRMTTSNLLPFFCVCVFFYSSLVQYLFFHQILMSVLVHIVVNQDVQILLDLTNVHVLLGKGWMMMVSVAGKRKLFQI